jgi:hypothetical protein
MDADAPRRKPAAPGQVATGNTEKPLPLLGTTWRKRWLRLTAGFQTGPRGHRAVHQRTGRSPGA